MISIEEIRNLKNLKPQGKLRIHITKLKIYGKPYNSGSYGITKVRRTKK